LALKRDLRTVALATSIFQITVKTTLHMEVAIMSMAKGKQVDREAYKEMATIRSQARSSSRVKLISWHL
jgi:hypothetical protein